MQGAQLLVLQKVFGLTLEFRVLLVSKTAFFDTV
jgi:hypothetical protein